MLGLRHRSNLLRLYAPCFLKATCATTRSLNLFRVSSAASLNSSCPSSIPRRIWSFQRISFTGVMFFHFTTYLDGVPPGQVNAYRGILDWDTISGTMVTWRLQRLDEVDCAACHSVRFLCAGVVRLEEVDLGDRRLNTRLWSPRQGYLEVTNGSGRQRLAPLNELRVRGIRYESSRMRARLPNCGRGHGQCRARRRGLVYSQRTQYVLLGFPTIVPQYCAFMPFFLQEDKSFVNLFDGTRSRNLLPALHNIPNCFE